ncbi:Hypothetical protein NTJ_09566 [Nesidiocoris tenuis]|uniref:Gustatory receptor n=1 Tax=Nesidiocoris tenuis TaxID=355587 RepID=A0ABN7AXK6_9HEMI|nr:Hypothetical protein NTJ_09566 [Nesidiocoris tenuis]
MNPPEDELFKWLKIMSVLGAFPFKMIDGQIVLHLRWALLALTISISTDILHIHQYSVCDGWYSRLQCRMMMIVNSSLIVLTTANLLGFILRRKTLACSIVSLLKIHRSIVSEPFRLPISIKILIINGIVVCSVNMVSDVLSSDNFEDLVYRIGWSYCCCYINSIVIVFFIVIQIPERCLSEMTKNLVNTAEEELSVFFKRYVATYDRLVDYSKTFNNCFDIQLLVAIVYAMIINVCNLYRLISCLFDSLGPIRMIAYVCYEIQANSGLVAIFVYCESLSRKVRRI